MSALRTTSAFHFTAMPRIAREQARSIANTSARHLGEIIHCRSPRPRVRRAHTLFELVVAMVASVVLLAGLGSVMFIAREIAYTPAAANQRTRAAEVVNQIVDELRHATLILQQTPRILEFIVPDRDNDGAAETIRYEWSGDAGDPLQRTVNGGQPWAILDSVHGFDIAATVVNKSETITRRNQSSEGLLLSTSMGTSSITGITRDYWMARRIDPSQFPNSVGGVAKNSALGWNATRIRFYGRNAINPHAGTVYVQLRPTGEPNASPSSHLLGEVIVPESAISSTNAWNEARFSPSISKLSFNRKYSLVWEGDVNVDGNHALLVTTGSAAGNVSRSINRGGSWETEAIEVFFELYGTYATTGTTYNVVRSYMPHIRLALQANPNSHARIEASVPLLNAPELLSAYWRADFDRNPTTTNHNGDNVVDWSVTGGGSFDNSRLIDGIWHASGALQTEPVNNFTSTTTIEVRCRNTTVGGSGAVMQIYAARQSGPASHAPLQVNLQRQSDGTQKLTLLGQSSASTTVPLFSRQRLSSEFVRYRLTIVPQSGVVNLQINGEDQGTFTYPTYAPLASTPRCLTVYADTSLAEFDYVDVRVAN